MIFNKLTEDAIIPMYQTSGSVGLDLHSNENVIVPPGERVLVGTGLTFAAPPGVEGQIRSRSGLALRYGLVVLNSPGTIDEDYTGEIKVLLYNSGKVTVSLVKGDRIAQMVLSKYYRQDNAQLDNIRQDKGFGSTGQ